ncbi:hypothetical protein H1R20_g607, partial [Candolleomyces eurysporus]
MRIPKGTPAAAPTSENGRTITVGFIAPDPGMPFQHAKVQEVVKEWEKYANLKFCFIPNGNNAKIRVSFAKTIIECTKRTQIPPWTEVETRTRILDVYSSAEISNFSAVDTTSIMILSAVNKAFTFLNYPFPIGASSHPDVNILNALNTARVIGGARANIALEYVEEGSI